MYKNILVATDGTRLSGKAMNFRGNWSLKFRRFA